MPIFVLGGMSLVSAFEAYVINVTAHIENALFVHPESLEFGTVFPQEKLNSTMFVTFSESFSAKSQERVGNVDYVLKEKPKPRPLYESSVGVDAARSWCHDNFPDELYPGLTIPGKQAWIDYLKNCYPSLCPYLSKEPDNLPSPGNDTGVEAFHDPFNPLNYYRGTIVKFGPGGTSINNDIADIITVDIDVPCFKDQCAQDWTHEGWELPRELEGQVFGCDLWVEVTKIY